MKSHASMNRIYRLVFNAATGMYVAVAETAKGRGKAGRSASAAMLAALTAAGALGALGGAHAQGLPTGGVVVTNNATISQTSNTLTVNQTGNAAILNWQSFSVGAGNAVRFDQPSASAVALNRVVGNSVSEIYGSLSANGRVMLVNQNGILMGAGAQVDTGGFIGSTLNIKDSDFLAGKYIFDIANNTGGTAGSIINNGRINTPGGYAVLIAPQVTNNGFIAARAGTVAIGAGNKVSLDMVGDGLISLTVDQAALNAAVVNSGTITANGGTVLIKASSANALFDTVLNSSGVIRADSITTQNGRIILDGGSTGITEVTGEISARGLNAGETGGSISVLGDKVGLLGNARLDASGDAGGGTVLVGGNWQGSGSERKSSMTHVNQDAQIDVSAVTTGDGGTAVIWSDGATRYFGNIKAMGGAQSGNGGNVEVSGKNYLAFEGTADRRAANGLAGMLLLDPTDLTVQEGGQTNVTTSTPFEPATASGSIVDWANIRTALGGGNVLIQTTTGFDAGQPGNITLNATTTDLAGMNSLTVRAANNILLNGLVKRSGSGSVSLQSLTAASGSISGAGGVQTAGGTVQYAANGTVNVGAAGITAGSGGISLNSGGAATQSGVISTSGTLTLQGAGSKTLNSVTNAVSAIANNSATAAISFKNGIALAVEGITIGSAGNGVAIENTAGNLTLTGPIQTTGGDITLKTPGTLAINSIISSGSGVVRLAGGGLISQTATITSSGGLGVNGAGTITLTQNNAITGNVAISNSNSGGSTQFKSTQGFNVNTVAADAGALFTTTNGISTNGDVTINSGGAIALTQGIATAGARTVRIQSAGAVTQAATGVITAANLGTRATAVDLSTAANAVSTNVALNASAGAAAFKNGAAFNVGTLTADGTLFTATAGISATGNNVTLDSAGAVTQTTGNNITASGLLLKGAGAYTLTNTTNSVGTIAASTGAGAIKYINAGALTVGTVNAVDGITRTGNVALNTQTGDLTLTKDINTGVNTNQVTLQALAGKVDQTAGVITTATLGTKAGGGDVALGISTNAVGTSVALAGTGDVKFKNNGSYQINTVAADAPVFSGVVNGISTSGAGKNITLEATAGTVTQAAGKNLSTTATGGLEIKGAGAFTLTEATNSVGKLAAATGAGDLSYRNAGALEIGTVNTAGITRTGNVTLQTGGALTQTAAVAAANLQLLGGQTATLTNAGNNIASLSGSTTDLSLTNTGALALGALTVAGPLTLNTGGTISQTGALTQTGAANAVNMTATAGAIKLTNTGNDIAGTVNLSAAAGGVALTNNNAAGIKVGNITAATTANTTNTADIANFTASDAALAGVVLLQSLQGNIERSGATKIVADRAVLVAANRIGGATATDATLGMRLEGAAGASMREVYVSAAATQMASTFGPATVPLFYKGLMNGAATLPSPLSTTYNGVAVDFNPAATAAAAAAVAAAAAKAATDAATTKATADAAAKAAADAAAKATGNTAAKTTVTTSTDNTAQAAQVVAQNEGPKFNPLQVVTRNAEPGRTSLNKTSVEPITVPSCTPGAARPASAGQC